MDSVNNQDVGSTPWGSASDVAYSAILDMILNGEVKGGEKLTESTLAEVIGVSRTPVREALRRLSLEGVVEMSKNQGSQVALMTDKESRELLVMRADLESAAVRLSVPYLTEEHVMELERIADEMEEMVTNPNYDVQKMTKLNTEFHTILMSKCENSFLLRAVKSLVLPASMARTYRLYPEESLLRSLRHHREVLDAAKAGDEAWAEAAMRTHILAARHAYAKPE